MSGRLQQLTARGLVKAYLLRSRIFRDNSPMPPLDRIKTETLRMLDKSFQQGAPAVLSGFQAPSEIFHVYGVTPMFTEFLAPMLAASDIAPRVLQTTHEAGFSRDTCSFHLAVLGAALEGYLPDYSLLVGTSHLCDGQSKSLEELARYNGTEYSLLDVPQRDGPAARRYLADQLRELEDRLARLTGYRARKEDWERVFALGNETRELLLEVNRQRRAEGCPLYGREAFTFGLLSLMLSGTSFLRDRCLEMTEYLRTRSSPPDNPHYRILWLLTYPYHQQSPISWLEEECGVLAVADELSYVFWNPLDPARPHESLAEKMLANPNLGAVENRLRMVRELVEEADVEGVVHYSHSGCRQGNGGVRPVMDTVRDMGLPFVELHGDCIDRSQFGWGQMRTRLEGFVELMARKRRAPSRESPADKTGYYLGVDIGSLTAKAVVVDRDGAIRDKRLFYTGASSKRTMARIRESILEAPELRGRIRACVATGYGRSAVDFAEREITEISCHARGMAEAVPGVRTIVDIGGQDTKAVSVDRTGAVQGFVMNDKCAAGTGRFLEMMARTLEVDIEDLGPLALKAKSAADISSLCSVFAESEVISLIAEDTARERIARGVCRSVAQRTKTMLDRVGIRREIAMSGGVSHNVGVVRELERVAGTRIRIPEEPQILGAYGAALLAAENDIS
ncbi:MAG: acyl-CoA dehydratase activase [Desulfohalobiaceae bacterium]